MSRTFDASHATSAEVRTAAAWTGAFLVALLAAISHVATGPAAYAVEIIIAVGSSVVFYGLHISCAVNRRALAEHHEVIDGIKRVGFVELAPNGTVQFWSHGAELLTGYLKAEVVGRRFDFLITAEDAAHGLADALRIASGNGCHEDWGWRLRQDGTRFWAVSLFSPLWRSDGRLRGYSVMFRDSTVRRIAEDVLQDKTELFESVINSTEDIVLVKDLRHTYQIVNAAGALFMARSPHEIIGRTDEELFPPEVADANMRADRETIDSGKSVIFESSDFDTGRKSTRTYLVHRTPWRDRDGEIVGVIAIGTDISDRKQRESDVVALNLYRSLFDDAPIAYHEVNLHGIITRSNRAECELLGYEEDELVGTSLWDLIAPEQREQAQEIFRDRIQGNSDEVQTSYREYLHKHGARIPMHVYTRRITDAKGSVTGTRTALVPAAAAGETIALLPRLSVNARRRKARLHQLEGARRLRT